MKQLLILSGKGGTGKTTIASAFIALYKAQAYADCDVDAPNLHLVGSQLPLLDESEFYGMEKAVIDNKLCTLCGLCMQHCEFDAISLTDEYKVIQPACEGCAVCELVCPADAISIHPNTVGKLMLYKDKESTFSTAKLYPGSGNSGLLVSEVKKRLFENTPENTKVSIIDGSPGIGCPVIASLSGADMVLIVAEPSLSGFSDMQRIIKTAASFETDIAVCVNKYDVNLDMTKRIEEYCTERELLFAGLIPYDITAVHAINQEKAVTDFDCVSADAIRHVYNTIFSRLGV